MGLFDRFSKEKEAKRGEDAAAGRETSGKVPVAGLSGLGGPARPAAPPLPASLFTPSDGPPVVPAAAPDPGAAQAPAAATAPVKAAEPGAEAGASEGDLKQRVIGVLRTCFDPEIPVNIYELGLIYDVEAEPGGVVAVKMTLTSPMCPVAGSLPPEVEAKIGKLPGVSAVKVELVWDPPWTPAMMTEAARLQLNMF